MSSPTMVLEQQRTGLWSHLLALVELTKPKIALLELMTVLVAACVASSGHSRQIDPGNQCTRRDGSCCRQCKCLEPVA